MSSLTTRWDAACATCRKGAWMTHLIDEYLPRADFAEAHQRWIDAGPDHVWQALTALSVQDLTITRPL